jgi:hypothetical protein
MPPILEQGESDGKSPPEPRVASLFPLLFTANYQRRTVRRRANLDGRRRQPWENGMTVAISQSLISEYFRK